MKVQRFEVHSKTD